MEVVRKNFKETLPLVKESIDKADFLAIDTEFTGLINGRDVTIFDSPEDYYLRLMNGSSEFLLIQFGMSCFYWDEKRNHYLNDTYNFYLYPRGRPGPDRLFLCQSSSLDFLASNGFDFNKLIREGISYMTSATETKLRENLAERQLSYSKEKDAVRIPDENRQQIEDIWILKVIRKTADMDDQDTLRKKKEWDELEEAIGFSRVAQMISQSEKLVVGHNMLLDLLHTLGHFFQQLPSDYPSFKEFSHCMFPKLLDTKYMSSLPPFKDKLGSSVLTELLSTLGEPPFSLPKIGSRQGRGYSHLDDKEHEAGYDAYITGLCFLAMHGHLARMRGEDSDRVQPQSVALKPFLNKLFLAKTARQDSPYINLDGADPTPPRDHVFHLVFPKEWQRSDLSQLFSPFGAVTVYFLDECSAFVGLDQRDQASDVMRVLSKNNRVTLTPYHKYKSGGSGGDTEMALRSERKSDTYKLINKADAKSRQGLSKSNLAGLRTSLQVPQLPRSPKSPMSPQPTQQRHKVNRTRSNSASLTTQPVSTRKRTSSGVFHVDGSEPVAKKSISPPLPDKTTNGRDKTDTGDTGKQDDDAVKKKDSSDKKKTGSEKKKDKAEKKKDNVEKKDKIVEKFDSKAMSDCVTAFKESDSWD
ncbi:poly(A)-specific ribonuclease PARN-like isoform X2 [Spodoptera litura]|uniref:Poly(A)-specific ribonuclease PARN-like isoform X2 n=1 Tax=Spodoptera litura TaxID=69820 RepID=A0A9J7J145_SPOLT|nr:poly(A)-specific ribonuclease PARN-like isoform X2 [Spodoptera litura]